MSKESIRSIHVELGDRSYPVHIGHGLLRQAELLTSCLRGRQVMIVSNETVAPLYLHALRDGLAGFQVSSIELPDGEQHKNLEVLETIYDRLLEERHERSTTLIALGGGVVGDMAGFAAATYQRGVDFIQVPTTLLAQVDSAVGGKTAVNHPLGKNMIGAFHQPRCVISDLGTLDTLPEREYRAGLAEVVKYGLIADRDFYCWLQEHADDLLARDPECLGVAVARSCEIKAEVVADDERESGRRAILNFGHTFGHAIETATAYSHCLHGEAVATGMVMALRMSCRLGLVDVSELDRLIDLLRRLHLPVAPPQGIDSGRFLELMAQDKKVLEGEIRLILLEQIGNAEVRADYDALVLQACLDESCASRSES